MRAVATDAVALPLPVTVPAPLRSGVSYARQTGVEHDVINPNSFEFVFIEVELKAQ